ncbi:MAG: carbohydrate kinase family protein [Candidatus Omnitrophica bacterium]|nr:carbohydrate kinase family protein [Candidatus Omnitrophota bacterium]MCM8770182.1 carbohydrate kinase family protein [Candidatus Omnitrophota bacterium]
MEKKVLCAGLLVGDFISKPVATMPERGKLTLVEKSELHVGGCAANTGLVLKRLGGKVAILGKVGEDNLGRFILRILQESGIETEAVKTIPGVTTSGTSVLVHPDGERSFIHSLGANALLSDEDFEEKYIEQFAILHLAGVLLMPRLEGESLTKVVKKAKSLGVTVCLDTAWDSRGVWMKALKGALSYVDYFLPSIEEARMITGCQTPEEIALYLLDCGVENVALKMGEKGSFIMNRQTKRYFPVLPIEVVDTTGSGDGYVAGFLAGLLRNLPFESCGLLGNLAGAKIATAIGANSGIASWEDLLAFGEKYGCSL